MSSGAPRAEAAGGHREPIGDEAALGHRAVEALGGTPPGAHRDPVSPLRWLLPPALGRRVARFDRQVETGFARLRGHRSVDRLFYSASALGDFSLLWHLVGASRGARSERLYGEAVRLEVALGIESVVVNVAVKSLFRRTRPIRQEHQRHRLRQPQSSSFPSGHATSGFLAAELLSEGRPAWQRVSWYLLASVVAASRVHVGIHHPSDVVAGALMGFGLGRLIRRGWPV